MITQTTEMAIQALILLAQEGSDAPRTPKDLAQRLGCSPTYLAKTAGQLVRAGVLTSHRGSQGGVALARTAETITLLEIIEACQGLMLGDYCRAIGDAAGPVCAFHQAMWETHRAMVKNLSSWTLADLAGRPGPTGRLKGNQQCRMFCVEQACATRKRAGDRD